MFRFPAGLFAFLLGAVVMLPAVAQTAQQSSTPVGVWTFRFSSEFFEQQREKAAEFILDQLDREELSSEELAFLEEHTIRWIEEIRKQFPLNIEFQSNNEVVMLDFQPDNENQPVSFDDDTLERARGEWIMNGREVVIALNGRLFVANLGSNRGSNRDIGFFLGLSPLPSRLLFKPVFTDLRPELEPIKDLFGFKLTRVE